jgi:hypothetical protein
MARAQMTRKSALRAVRFGLISGLSAILLAQQPSKPTGYTIEITPPEPIAVGACASSTFGYLELNGKRTDFTEAEFGRMILPALRQGYVLTIYPPTKSGIFVNQQCHNSKD